MPTYDYECRACGKSFEFFQSISEPPKTKCPACRKRKLERQLGTGVGFLFKGPGFYVTDYRSADYKAKAKAESDSSSKTPKSSDSTGSTPSSKPSSSQKPSSSKKPSSPNKSGKS
jgi:putative FmdB family regulatory protein